jgi:hypothetical protein
MIDQQHPITLPLEMVEQWADMLSSRSDHAVFSLVAQWGADQELEACCMWITREKSVLIAEELGIARRPKPPSLKEQALAALNVIEDKMLGPTTEEILIRKALEALPE